MSRPGRALLVIVATAACSGARSALRIEEGEVLGSTSQLDESGGLAVTAHGIFVVETADAELVTFWNRVARGTCGAVHVGTPELRAESNAPAAAHFLNVCDDIHYGLDGRNLSGGDDLPRVASEVAGTKIRVAA